MRRVVLILAIAFAPFVPLACGSSGGPNGGSPEGDASAADAGVKVDAAVLSDGGTVDGAPPIDSPASAADAPNDSSDDAADALDSAADTGPDAGAPLVAGPKLHLFAETADGYLVYWGPSSPGATTWGIFAVPVSGGTSTLIAGPISGYFGVEIYGPDAFIWELGTNSTNSVGPLSVWSHANGYHSLSTASVNTNAVASQDGSLVVFATNVTDSQKDIAFAHNDGTAITTVLPGVYREACDYFTAFAGNSFVVQHCDAPLPDGGAVGTVPPTLTLFPSPSADAGILLATMPANPGGDSWSIDPAGDLVYAPEVADPPIGAVFGIPDGGATTIDSTGALTGEFVNDGGAVVFRTPGGALRISPTANPAPVTLLDSGVTGLVETSPNGEYVTFFTQVATDTSGDVLEDLSLASTSAPGTVLQIEPTPTASFLGSLFTADSSYVLYSVSTLADTGIGTLEAAPVTTGVSVQIATGVVANTAVTGAKVVFAGNYSSAANTADLESVDLAVGTSPTLIASGAVPVYVVTRDKANVIYSTSSGTPGIYIVPIP